jgi:hypothetical protein
MAELLDIDRSMFFHVKSGRRNLSKKALFRLEEVERIAGIATLAPATPDTRHVPPDTPPSSLSHKEKDQILARLAKMEADIQAIREAVKGL